MTGTTLCTKHNTVVGNFLTWHPGMPVACLMSFSVGDDLKAIAIEKVELYFCMTVKADLVVLN